MNPQSFGKYQLIKKLATGGMAEVWLARQTGIEGFAKNVVVKRILPHLAEDHEFVEMFRNEALIAARFNHPNIAQVYEFGEANGAYFIAMEYIHGEDLGRVMRKAYNAGQWLARPLAIRIVASACEGLYYAHTRTDDAGRPLRVVHRDISPQNILISFDGSVKLVDFGIAKAADQASLTKSGAIKGKFAYMAPEQAAGKVLDARADIFAIGLVLYELLTGVRPLKRESELGTLQAALECAIPPPSEVADVPSELDPVVMRALAKAADDRYRDARQFQLALEEFLVGQRWVATSVQVSELMEALFADRLEEERRSGSPAPAGEDSRPAATPQPEEPPPPPPGESRRTSSEEHTSADMSWEAPPGEMVPQRGRTSVRQAPRSRSDTGTHTLAAPVEEEEEWEAPPSTEVGGRRRMTGARTSSRPEEARGGGGETVAGRRTGDAPAIRRSGMRMTPGADAEAPAPRPSRGGAPALNARARPLEVEEEDDERTQLPEPEPPRRRTGQAPSPQAESPRQRASRAELPQAAARRRTSVEKEKKDEPRSPVKAPKAPLPVKQLLGVVTALLLVGVVAVFREPIWNTLNSSAIDGQALQINLETEQPVRVFVEHSERCGSREKMTVLSDQPTTKLQKALGAHEQDVLILENKPQGIYRRVPIPFGAPNETVRTIPRIEFKKGGLKLRLLPKNIPSLDIYRDGVKIATYTGLTLSLVEGTHNLELRAEGVLKTPVQLDPILIKAGETSVSTLVDLRPYLVQ